MKRPTQQSRGKRPGRALPVDDARLVLHLAGRVARMNHMAHLLDDIIGEGYLALCIARRHFDPSRGVRFLTFAWHVIENAMVAFCIRQRRHHKGREGYLSSFEPTTPDARPGEYAVIDWSRVKAGDAAILRARMAGRSLRAIGEGLGVSAERVRIRQNQALRRAIKII